MSKLSRKVIAVGLSLTTAVWLAGSIIPASAQTSAATIATLMAQIQALQAQLVALQGSAVSTPSSSFSFTKDLTLGSKGTDVTALQQYLVSGGYLKMPAGVAYGYFGSATKTAVAGWQKAKGVSATGYFGPKSRAAIALAGGMGTGTGTGTGPVVVVPTGSDLVVSLASDTPGALIIGSGTAFNRALKVNLTAGSKAVNVTGITLMKAGFVANTSLNGVDIVDAAGVRHGNVITSINADNTIGVTFPSAPITVPAGMSTSFTVRFNLLSGALSGTVGFSITAASAITADTTAVSGSFPIAGSLMQIVNGGSSLASTTFDVLTGTGSSTLNVDAVSLQEITKFRVSETTSNEAVKLYSISLYNNGSGADTDVRDVQLMDQAGNVLATAQQVGKYVNFVLATPYFIDKGQTKDLTVKAKIVDGAARTINFVVYNNYDIDLRGVSTLVSVMPGAGTNDTGFPIGNGFNIQTIGSGSITQTKASDSPSSAVVPGSNNVVMAKYTVKPTGENYELRAVKFYIATSNITAAIALTGTVYVKVNGAIVYSTAASNISKTTATEYTLSSYPIITSGQNSTITIEASVNSTATTNDTYLVKSFQVTTAKRLTTNDLVTNPTSATDANSISVKAAALAVTTLSTPVANSVVAGTSQYEYATIKLDASTGGEDIKVSKVIVTSDGLNLTEVQNLYLYKDSDTSPLTTTASTASKAATITFSFSSPITVTRTTPVLLHLKADAVAATASHTFYVASSTSAVTAVGSDTGNSLTNGTDISFAGAGQAQTHVAAGSLTIALADGSPTLNQVVSAGSTQTEFFAFTLTSRYEAQKITKIKVYASSSAGLLSTTTLQNVSFYEGSNATPFAASVTPVCQDNATVAPTGTWCTYTYQAADNVLSAAVPITGTTIHVKANIGGGGSAALGDNFKFMIVSSTDSINVKGNVTGSTSGTRTGTPAANGTTYVVSGPVTISADDTYIDTTSNTGAGMRAGIFKITNSSGATVRLSTSTVLRFNQTGSATSSFDLYIGDSVAGATTQLSGNHPTSVSSLVTFDISTSTAAYRQITNGATKYLVIKNIEATASGSTWGFSVAALGQILYQVDEASLGYDSNPYSGVSDLSAVAQGLYLGLNPTSGPANSIVSVNSSY